MRNLIFLFGISLILGSCTLPWNRSEPVPTSYKDDLEIASSKIKETVEFEECMRPHVNMCVSSVGMKLSQEKKDISFCDELTGETDQNNCRYVMTIILATEKKDKSICDSLSGSERDNCRYSIISAEAREKNDPKICESIIPPDIALDSTEYLIYADQKNRCVRDLNPAI